MHRVTVLVAPHFELLDLSGPVCAFSVARDHFALPYDVGVVSTYGGSVLTCDGIAIETLHPDQRPDCDTLVVAGGAKAHDEFESAQLTSTLLGLGLSSGRIASVCTGAFYLAEAGLLDGRRATTHWRFTLLLRSRYPKVSVEMDRIYVHDGDVWTSAGITAGIDLALAMIEADFGSEMSKSVAREMVIHHRRHGGQSQFSSLLEMESGSPRVRNALAFARDNLTENLSVERLAEVSCVSSRQFSRLFLAETGETPARAVERIRAEAARHCIEDGRETFDAIARAVGFGNVERMRRTFVKLYGHTPQAIRRTAQSPTGSAS